MSVSFKTGGDGLSTMQDMRVGIGLPAAVPDADMALMGDWAAEAEGLGFASVGVIDRLVYDNLDPLTALAAAAARTGRIELTSTVVNVCWRANAVLLAKQLASVDRLSGGRLTAGLGMGGWPADYEASGVPLAGRGRLFEASLDAMERAWREGGGAPRILLGGIVPAAFVRAAREMSDGWVSPLFDLPTLRDGAAAVAHAWDEAGREGRPRIMTGRYFCLGPDADSTADAYIHHYYGDEYFDPARSETLTTADQIDAELRRLQEAGCDDVLLFPCAGDLDQMSRLAEATVRTDSG